MNVVYTARFRKHFRKRIRELPALHKKFEDRMTRFKENPRDSLLRDHALSGNLKGYRSFSITGDIRVIYFIRDETIHFVDIGSHAQMYRG